MENTDTVAPLLTLTAAGAGTFNSPVSYNPWGAGCNVVINVTVDTAGAVVFNLQGYDPATQQFYTIASTASLVATGPNMLSVYPGILPVTATASVAAFSALLPRSYRVQAVVTTGPISATVGCSVII
jgi:hypothetical protein